MPIDAGRSHLACCLLVAACWSLGGCDAADPGATGRNTAEPGANFSSSATAAATEHAAQSATPPAPRHPHAGAWHGAYDAVKGEVSVPTGVQYQSWKADDGSERSGKGEIKLIVENDGSVSGHSQGALGKQALRGQMDGDTLRAGVFAETPDEGMSGVLTGVVKGTELTAKLQVSDGRGNLVRQSAVVLSRAAVADGR